MFKRNQPKNSSYKKVKVSYTASTSRILCTIIVTDQAVINNLKCEYIKWIIEFSKRDKFLKTKQVGMERETTLDFWIKTWKICKCTSFWQHKQKILIFKCSWEEIFS
jgi:hypothetical protein